ncbi:MULTISPECIES: hypothetical protein [Nocardiaceae]|uniref:Core-binding (CB) domain-containing protein n=1 Tax=Rhodococcoides kroppenstedtii TaxID=293050 RepID=A0ABS7NTT3_9NOCA|nr:MULTISPECIES: hypothetical protein [Rhodococcus]MBY6313927.1 hypothetical protein [Rhodococcus kroppenstedtii]MBY6321431.1 hypothetical protein [Rhodococcus kroppenstedtii]MBY6400129.1 hypothetical protein [Rhodococcus kroppenstedtii]
MAAPTGTWRTVATARHNWGVWRDFILFLAELPVPPVRPDALTVEHVKAYHAYRQSRSSEAYAWKDRQCVGVLLRSGEMKRLVPADVLAFARARGVGQVPVPKSGYSDGELHRLVTAARSDVVAIRNRFAKSCVLIEKFREAPGQLDEPDRRAASLLVEIAATGEAPRIVPKDRRELMSKQFVVLPDLVPLLVLMVAVTGLNVESVKELPAAHRILGDRAVEVEVLKRRRGSGRWHTTVTWEVGQPGRELHTPGGLYLLLHRLMGPGRDCSQTESLWSIWRNPTGTRDGSRLASHVAPFATRLDSTFNNAKWTRRHGLLADQLSPPSDGDGVQSSAKELLLEFNRLKTSVDVRRTKSLGGYLPSAARTNTVPVLYRNYLRNDPYTRDWAEEIIAEAMVDAEQVAHVTARRETVGGKTSRRFTGTVIVGQDNHVATGTNAEGCVDATEAAWSACRNPARHPASEKPCTVSFIDCFSCENSVVSGHHLPQLIALSDDLANRRGMLSSDEWGHRYGSAWDAIHRDILPKFTPAEVGRARELAGESSLELVEEPWESP